MNNTITKEGTTQSQVVAWGQLLKITIIRMKVLIRNNIRRKTTIIIIITKMGSEKEETYGIINLNILER